ncbi:MAG: hypothetical protein ACYCS8_12780 [Acidithiobacillus sp.]
MKKQIIAVAAVLSSFIPAAAFAGPSLGIGYSNVGLSGHSGRPGVTLSAGNLYSNNVVATGSATIARGYYNVGANIGKLIPTGGTVSFEPYLGLDFLNLNYNQAETGYTTSQVNAGYGYSYTQTTPYSYTQGASIQDFYALAGANMNIPLGQRVMLQFGGGYGHTLTVLNGSGGAVYKGKAEVGFQIAPRVTANLHVSYLHVPGANLTTEGVGLAYQFS